MDLIEKYGPPDVHTYLKRLVDRADRAYGRQPVVSVPAFGYTVPGSRFVIPAEVQASIDVLPRRDAVAARQAFVRVLMAHEVKQRRQQ